MDEFDILKELEKLEDDIEPGFLSELRFEAPDELHSRIMNSIRQEIKPRTRFNYKRYTAFAVAAALFVCAYIGGGKAILLDKNPAEQQNPTITSDKVKTYVIPTQPIRITDKTLTTKPNTNNIAPKKQTNIPKFSAIVPKKTKVNKTAGNSKIVAKANTGQTYNGKVNDTTTNKKNTNTNNNQGSNIVATNTKAKDKTIVAAIDKAIVNVPAKPNNTLNSLPTVSTSKKAGNPGDNTPAGDNTKAGTDINVTPPLTGTPDNQIPEKILVADNTAPIDTNTNTSDIANTSMPAIDINNIPSGPQIANLALDNFVNYEINLNMSQISIIQFIKEKGTKISEIIYKLSKTDYDKLDSILIENGVAKTVVNSANGQFVIIKMIMY